MSAYLSSGNKMNAAYFAAAGLLSLVGGVLLVNAVVTPRAAQIGTIMAGCGVLLLALVAIRQLVI
jgi:hypothetical protein